MTLSRNDLHALRGLVRAHLKRKARRLDRPGHFDPRLGQTQAEADKVRADAQATYDFYSDLHDRVRVVEKATPEGA